MGKHDTEDLKRFLGPFGAREVALAWSLRDFVWDLYPTANELIYDNYNALAFGWSPTHKVGHTFCSVAIGRSSGNVHFGFYWGSEIADPEKLLLGEGKQYRYLLVKEWESFPQSYVKSLLVDAYENSMAKVKNEKDLRQGDTVTKSVSEAKRGGKKPPDTDEGSK